MQLMMGHMPRDRRIAAEMELEGTERHSAWTLDEISFRAYPGDRVSAYLMVPHSLTGRTAAMLCLHQTTTAGKDEPAGLAGDHSLHYAQELVQRGFVCLVPDYPGFGAYLSWDCAASPGRYGSEGTTLKGVLNHMAAIDLLETLDCVGSCRIGCIGHSLGGHNGLFLAVFDERVRATVSSCGFCSFATYHNGDFGNWSSGKYMPRIARLYNNSAADLPVDFGEMLAAIAPRPVFVSAPVGDTDFAVAGVKACVQTASPRYRFFGKEQHLKVLYPRAGHEFPDQVRGHAYAFLEKHLVQRAATVD